MFLAYLCERETKRVTSPFPFEIEDTFTPRLDVHIQGKNLDLAFVTPEMLLFVWSCHSSLESILDVGPSPGTHARHPRKFFAAGYGFWLISHSSPSLTYPLQTSMKRKKGSSAREIEREAATLKGDRV